MARLQFRVWQVWITALTTLVAAWFFTFGAIAGVIALVVAKHILVAVFLIGMDIYPAYIDDRELRDAGF